MGIIERGQAILDHCGKLRQIGRLELGRILGTVPATSGAAKAFMGIFERSFFGRGELNALTALLVRKGVFTADEWEKQLEEEYAHLVKSFGASWPEVELQAHAIVIKDVQGFAERSKREGWPP